MFILSQNSLISLYRSVVGLLSHPSHDRTDMQFTMRFLCAEMRDPSEVSMKRLERAVRYLDSTRDLGVWLSKHGAVDKIIGDSDTDWAGENAQGSRQDAF